MPLDSWSSRCVIVFAFSTDSSVISSFYVDDVDVR